MMPIVMPQTSLGDTHALTRRLSERISPRHNKDGHPRVRRMTSMHAGALHREQGDSFSEEEHTRQPRRTMSLMSDSAASPNITESWPWRGLGDVSGTSPIEPLSFEENMAMFQEHFRQSTTAQGRESYPTRHRSMLGIRLGSNNDENERASPVDAQRPTPSRQPSFTFGKLSNPFVQGYRRESDTGASLSSRRSGAMHGLTRRLTIPGTFRKESGSTRRKAPETPSVLPLNPFVSGNAVHTDSPQSVSPLGRVDDSAVPAPALNTSAPIFGATTLPYADDGTQRLARTTSPLALSQNTTQFASTVNAGTPPVSDTTESVPPSAEDVELTVNPTSDKINMFGSLQVATNYSLSGTVDLSLRSNAAGRFEVRDLNVVFTGYSIYVDSSSRFACTRVCEISVPLQQQSTHVNFDVNGTCESDFDLFVPGWLPASFNARYSSTFYSLQAHATVAGLNVHSKPRLIVLQRSRELVPIPVAQMAIFNGAAVPEVPHIKSKNPFRAATNPFRTTSNPFVSETHEEYDQSVPAVGNNTDERNQNDRERLARRVPLRHFAHSQHLQLPESLGGGKLPIKLTLSVPSHTHTTINLEEEQLPLLFGVQIELDDGWAKARSAGGLRLRELEAMCVQMEKYSTTPSRSYCAAFALGSQGKDSRALDLPRFDLNTFRDHPGYAESDGMPIYPYNTHLVRYRMNQEISGTELVEWDNAADRFHSFTVGPLSQEASTKSKNRPAQEESSRAPEPRAAPAPPQHQPSRRRRIYSTAIPRLSAIAAAIRDSGNDTPRDPGNQRSPSGVQRDEPNERAREHIKASYEFEGRDGNGMELLKRRERLSFSLPLVPSSSRRASSLDTVQLFPDYESPHVRIRHKLKVKLTFTFGVTGLPAQNLVLCVPTRFTEAPAHEALAQASPIVFPPAARSCVPAEGMPAAAVPLAYTLATRGPEVDNDQTGAPYLPAYTQLFREDGSRLGDDLEELPQYPNASPYLPRGATETELSMRLANVLAIVQDDVRDRKTPASTSYVEASAGDIMFDNEGFTEIQVQDDDMMHMEDAGGAVENEAAFADASTDLVTVGEPAVTQGTRLNTRDATSPEPSVAPAPPFVTSNLGALAPPVTGSSFMSSAVPTSYGSNSTFV